MGEREQEAALRVRTVLRHSTVGALLASAGCSVDVTHLLQASDKAKFDKNQPGRVGS